MTTRDQEQAPLDELRETLLGLIQDHARVHLGRECEACPEWVEKFEQAVAKKVRDSALLVMMRVGTVTTDAALAAFIDRHEPDSLERNLAELVRDLRIALTEASR